MAQVNHELISLELTEGCNHACRHCYNFWRAGGRMIRRSPGPRLSREDIRQIVDRIRQETPLRYVALSGGEPLLRKDFAGIVRDLVDIGLHPIVITNGALLTSGLLKRLPSEVTYEVSLLSYREAEHNALSGSASFSSVVANVARAARRGSGLTVGFVAMRQNVLAARRTMELAMVAGATGFMYNRVNLSSGTVEAARDLIPSQGMLRESLGELQDGKRKYGMSVVCSVPIPACVVAPSEFPDIKFGWCPRGGKNAYYTIGCDGLLRPCNHSSLRLGDVRSESFAALTTSPSARRYWRIVPKECRDCRHPNRRECHSGCTAAAAEALGSQRLMDPFISLALGREPRSDSLADRELPGTIRFL